MPHELFNKKVAHGESYQSEKQASIEETSGNLSRRDLLRIGGSGFAVLLLERNPRKLAALLENLGESKEPINVPKIKFDFFFFTHAGETDAQKIGEKIKSADIYVPEAAGWSEETLDVLQRVAWGKMTPTEFLLSVGIFESEMSDPVNQSRLAQLEAIYNSGVTIRVVDIKEDDPLFKALDANIQARNQIIGFYTDFSSLLSRFRANLEEFAAIQYKREEVILKNIEKLKGEIIADVSSGGFTSKKDVRILFSLGAAHTLIAHKQALATKNAVWSFAALPLVYDFEAEVFRRTLFGKKISEDLLARSLVDRIARGVVYPQLPSITKDYNKIIRFRRFVLSRFTRADIDEIFQKARMATDGFRVFSNLFLEKMKKKSIAVPSSEEELDKILITRGE